MTFIPILTNESAEQFEESMKQAEQKIKKAVKRFKIQPEKLFPLFSESIDWAQFSSTKTKG